MISKQKPLVSVITVVLNGEKYIETAIKSVINQSYNKIEYILIDGGSTDTTLDIIKKYEENIDYWISEPDKGLYDAMNKGIKVASGNLIGILNSDDWYYLDSVEKIVNEYNKNSEIGLFHGILSIYDSNKIFITDKKPKLNMKMSKYFTTPFKHPTCFVNRSVYIDIGLYDLKYSLLADYDFMLRLLKEKISTVYISKPITNLLRVGLTSGSEGISGIEELKSILLKHTKSRLSVIFIIRVRQLNKLKQIKFLKKYLFG